MSSVRFVFPKVKLEALIRAPGGLTVADAVARAAANLETIKPTCRAELMMLLEQAEAASADMSEAADGRALDQLYAIAVRGIGVGAVCGAPDVDGALNSFCDLIGALQASGRRDVEPIRVHLGAWRLLMDPALPRVGGAAIVGGLRKVSARYTQSLAS